MTTNVEDKQRQILLDLDPMTIYFEEHGNKDEYAIPASDISMKLDCG